MLTLTCIPVALAAPENICRTSWASLALSSMGVLEKGATCTIVELLTKQYHTILVMLPDMQNLKAAPWPYYLKQNSIVGINIAHMGGDTPFP